MVYDWRGNGSDRGGAGSGVQAPKIGGTTLVQAAGGGGSSSSSKIGGSTLVAQLSPAPGTATGGSAQTTVDPKPIIDRLDATLMPIFFGIINGTFDIDGITAWMQRLNQAIADAKSAGASSAELASAVDRCTGLMMPVLQTIAEDIRAATVQLTNDSSVSKAAPAAASFPSQAQIKNFNTAAGKLSELGRDAGVPGAADSKTLMQSTSAVVQDAGLAMLQSLSVASARTRWKTGTDTQTPSNANAGKGDRNEVDEIFSESGFGNRASVDDDKGRVFDWCGMFVVSSQFSGAGLAQQLRGGFWHTDNVQDFFKYEQATNANRVPKSIWAESQWWTLKDYHLQRGSQRKWIPRATIKAALEGGGPADIRPGDTCLIDHGGGNDPSHIVMVESYDAATGQLVTIEGNTHGIHANASGVAERLDTGELKNSTHGAGTATGLHVRDLRTLAPGAGSYVVNDAKSFVREADDLTKVKIVDSKGVVIPKGETVEVLEVKTDGGKRYGNVDGWGWTLMSNLQLPGSNVPAGGYKAKSGSTVWGVGRPSVVDFEDGHDYAVNAVPAALKTTSPAGIRELAKKSGSAGKPARDIELKK